MNSPLDVHLGWGKLRDVEIKEREIELAGPFVIKRAGPNLSYLVFYPRRHSISIFEDSQISSSVDIGFSTARVLEILIARAGTVVDRADIIGYAWPRRFVTQSSLNQAVKNIREWLGGELAKDTIQTVPRHGYQLDRDSLLNPENFPFLADQATDTEQVPAEGMASMTNVLPRLIILVTALVFIGWGGLKWYGNNENSRAQGDMAYAEQQAKSALRKPAKELRDRMLRLAPATTIIVVGRELDYYEVVCISENEDPRFLFVHSTLISDITDERLRECLG